jgi:hypothetical protein
MMEVPGSLRRDDLVKIKMGPSLMGPSAEDRSARHCRNVLLRGHVDAATAVERADRKWDAARFGRQPGHWYILEACVG